MSKKVAVIGAGPAGCFCAINLKKARPGCEVTVFEAGTRPLAKLALTGGGRCNISNTFASVRDLGEVYPRGAKLLKGLFKAFGPGQTREWFASEGISFIEEDGGRLFPESQDAMQVVRLLERLMAREGVTLRCDSPIVSIAAVDDSIRIGLADGHSQPSSGGQWGEGSIPEGGNYRFLNPMTAGAPQLFNAVVIATGGFSRGRKPQMLEGLDIPFEDPVPSLFSLKINDTGLTSLNGISVPGARVSIPGTKLAAEGALLITDWGLSGPAILKLSSYAARHLSLNAYKTPLAINWTGLNEQQMRESLGSLSASNPRKQVLNSRPDSLPARLWEQLVRRSGIREDARWAELGPKSVNRLVNTLINDSYDVSGKATFKDEFVTCGGVSLAGINPSTLNSKTHPEIYFAGEALDVDGVTGGFNLQAA